MFRLASCCIPMSRHVELRPVAACGLPYRVLQNPQGRSARGAGLPRKRRSHPEVRRTGCRACRPGAVWAHVSCSHSASSIRYQQTGKVFGVGLCGVSCLREPIFENALDLVLSDAHTATDSVNRHASISDMRPKSFRFDREKLSRYRNRILLFLDIHHLFLPLLYWCLYFVLCLSPILLDFSVEIIYFHIYGYRIKAWGIKAWG